MSDRCIALALPQRRRAGADHRARRLVRENRVVGRRALRDRHQDGLVRQGAGIKVELVPLPGSTDCVKAVATKDVQYGVPSIEPVAIIRPQGVKIKNFYTAYQANIYGIAVPEDSPIKTFADLKGKKIGVTSMASAGVIVARALATSNGLDPDKDVSIVVAGEAAQTAALLRSQAGRRALAVRHAICADRERRRQAAHARHQGYRDLPVERLHRAGGSACQQSRRGGRAGARATRWARCSRSPIPKPRSASCGRSIRRPRRPARTRRPRMRDDVKTLEARAQKLAAGIGRREEVGREPRRELRRLCRLPGQERRAEGEGAWRAIWSPTT